MLPVNEPEFWKERLAAAKARGDLHFSVYAAHHDLWQFIRVEHEKIILQHTKPNDFVLDAGCGYGRLARLFPPKRYVGVDISPDLIREAKQEHRGHEFIVADLTGLPFKSNQFNTAIVVSIRQMVIRNLGTKEWDKMDAEIKRVARRVLFLEYEKPQIFELYENR